MPRAGRYSPTGAAGPFQFIPSTAKQYGLTDPTDPDASVIAAKKLTQDNAAAFEKINGRPPTAPELALMHRQQGGVTMAPAWWPAPATLAAWQPGGQQRQPESASPQQAVAKIQGYYVACPNVPVNVRDTIAQTMAQGRPPVCLKAWPARRRSCRGATWLAARSAAARHGSRAR